MFVATISQSPFLGQVPVSVFTGRVQTIASSGQVGPRLHGKDASKEQFIQDLRKLQTHTALSSLIHMGLSFGIGVITTTSPAQFFS